MGRRRAIFFLTQEKTQNYETFNYGIKMIPNYLENVSQNCNTHEKLTLF
jgi:hypothetical protein